ncbi:hypothetical protein [Lactococcus garvieae]|uniref:Lipoprotein, putative n=1 Tax=Lactococcus garvieae DCC43 TaxID=1231377 RepID=K2PYV6_9LACT|nr:hypothetical protein [Lactococcus garvieae]EKF52576.1 lipoprotein, putative [Lactococcus garvieae DCC43]
MKNNKKNLYIIIAFCILLFMGGYKVVHAEGQPQERVSIELYASNNGTPIRGGIFNAINLENAYKKLMSGEISLEETQTASWKAIQAQLQTDKVETNTDIIQFSNGLTIAPGMKHTSEEAYRLVENILKMGGWGSTFLTDLNGPTEKIRFRQAGRGRDSNTFTNEKGEAVATVLTGLTAIMSGDNNFQKLVNITDDNQKLKLDTANKDRRLSITLKNEDIKERSSFGSYIVDASKPLNYQLKVSKDINHLGGVIIVKSTANLTIDSVSSVDESLEDLTIEQTNTLGDVINPEWQVTFPALTRDLVLNVTAHLMPTAVKDIQKMGETLTVSGIDDIGSSVVSVSPAVVVSGANFVMMDNQKNKLVTGGEYVLGRYVGKTYQIYSKQDGWTDVTNLNEIDSDKAMVLQGGNQYFIGETEPFSIPKATNRFNYDSDVNDKLNKSLIQITGLAQGDNYFLYPIKPVSNYKLVRRPFNFSVFSDFSIGSNGSVLTNTSLENAKIQNFSLNTTIPDFQTNVNEYNVLDVKGSSVTTVNSLTRIIIPIAVLCIIMFVVMILLVRFV